MRIGFTGRSDAEYRYDHYSQFDTTVFPPNTLTVIGLVSGDLLISNDNGVGGYTSINGNGVVALGGQGAGCVVQVLSVSGLKNLRSI